MKLLLIHQAFVSVNDAGGTRHVEFGQYLVEHGDQLTVIASQINYLTGEPIAGRPAGLRRGLFYRERDGGIQVMRAYAPAVLHKSFVWRVVAFLVFALTSVWAGLRAGTVDVVMGTSPPIFQAVSALLVARIRRKPFLLEIRDLWPDFAIDMGVLRNPILKAIARRLEQYLYQRADHLLVNSPAYLDYLVNKGIARERISVVPNGVDVSMFDPSDSGVEIREQFDLEEKFIAIYAGAHGVANDLDTLLNAAAYLSEYPEIHILFVGDGKERERLQRDAVARGLTNVTFAGPLPKSRMPMVLAAADVCVATLKNIPMFSTTYPNKIFDYMAAGRPTILAIDGVIRRVIEDANGGFFVPPGDARSLAEGLKALCTDEPKRAAMGQSARDYVVTRFNRRDQAKRFRKVIYSVATCQVSTFGSDSRQADGER